MTVRLPLAAIDAKKLEKPSSKPLEPRSASACRVLVADDNVDAAETIAMLLGSTGCQVRTVHDGPAALRAAEEFRPELVLLDLGMPGMDGAEVCTKLREERWASDATIVAITGWGRDDDRRRTREAGFDHHLVKPVDPAALVRLVHDLPRH